MPRGRGEGDALAALAKRLGERLTEVEEAVRTRVFAISDAELAADPAYGPGLREAVSVAMDLALAGVSRESPSQQQAPLPLLSQARLAARAGVSLDTVLRRYFAGFSIEGLAGKALKFVVNSNLIVGSAICLKGGLGG